MGCNLYFDDGLVVSTIGDYFYFMRYYVYSGVRMCEYLFIALYSYNLKGLLLRSLIYKRLKSQSLVSLGIGLGNELCDELLVN